MLRRLSCCECERKRRPEADFESSDQCDGADDGVRRRRGGQRLVTSKLLLALVMWLVRRSKDERLEIE